MQQKQKQSRSPSSSPPAIQPAPSAGSASLAYSMATADLVMTENNHNNTAGDQPPRQRQQQQQQQTQQQQPIQMAPSLDYSIYSGGETSAEQYYAAHVVGAGQQLYQEQLMDPIMQQQQMHHNHNMQQQSANNYENDNDDDPYHDATPTVHEMHRQLLYLLSHPELFSEAMEWQSKVDRGLDPSRIDDGDDEDDGANNGIQSFDNEFEEQSLATTTAAAEEHKEEVNDDDTTNTKSDKKNTNDNKSSANSTNNKYQHQQRLLPPLPLQIFAPDAEVVLPQALTATQLFGLERLTGMELEAAAGTYGLCALFLRWLALLPEGDHRNVVDPPGLTVMRISGGRYRVTGAHRVVWRWMNKFSPVKNNFDLASGSGGAAGSTESRQANNEKGDDNNQNNTDDHNNDDTPDTDFDFGDLVTMTIVDVFETDSRGRLLSYCPTFDNRAVHKTQESIERLRKGASQFKERMEGVAKSPAGQNVNKVAGKMGKLSLDAAWKVGNIVRSKIEGEIQKHQQQQAQQQAQAQQQQQNELGSKGGDASVDPSLEDAVGGDDDVSKDEVSA